MSLTLLGRGYYKDKNFILATCSLCGQLTSGVLAQPLIIRCQCGKTNFEKPPLHYLLTKPNVMIIYKFTHPSGKEFVGVIITGNHNKPQQKVIREVEYIRDFRRKHIQPEFINDLHGIDLADCTFEVLHVTDSFTNAMITEKLHINLADSLHPNGYNACYMLETLTKWKK